MYCFFQNLVQAIAKTQSIHAQQVVKSETGEEVSFVQFCLFLLLVVNPM